jgi:hypothetical protein
MSINERKHPDVQETSMDFLSPDELTAFTSFRSALSSLSPAHDSLTDYTLYRFLKVNNFDVAAAQSQFLSYMQWREEQQLSDILSSLPARIDTIRALVPHAYHGEDRDGRPVYIEKTGKISCAALADESILPRADFMRSHVWGVENIMVKAHESSLRRGRRVETFTSIIDMNGLGFAHRNALPLLNACMTLDSLRYPEFIGKLFVLNTPWVAPMMYNAAAPFVPSEIRARVYVLKDQGDLTEHVAPDQLPVELGGTCSLHGGLLCVPEPDASALIAQVQGVEDDGLEKQYVSSTFDKALACGDEGGVFTWFFECDPGYDIEFSVEISDAAGRRYAKQPSRCQTNRGSYASKGRADVRLYWDNSFSWLTGKNLKFSASVVHVDENVKGAANAGL